MTSTLNDTFTPIRRYAQFAPEPVANNEITGDMPWVDFNAILTEIIDPYPAVKTALLRALEKYDAAHLLDPLETQPHGPRL